MLDAAKRHSRYQGFAYQCKKIHATLKSNLDDTTPLSSIQSETIHFTRRFEAVLLGFLLAFSFGIRLYYAWQPLQTLLKHGIADDAFYYLTIARNLAKGLGPTFDGLSPTNGFHPLFTILLIPFFWFYPNSPDLTARLALVLLIVCATLTALPIYAILSQVASRKAGLFAATLWLFNPWAFFITLGGVETAVYIFCASLAIWLYLRAFRTTGSVLTPWTWLGAILGLLLLARTDGIFLLVAIVIDLVWDWASVSRSGRHPGGVIPSIKVGLLLVVCVVVYAPWLIWNIMTFGTPIQVSGQAVYWHTHAGVNVSGLVFARMSQSVLRTLFLAILFSSQPLLVAILLLFLRLIRRKRICMQLTSQVDTYWRRLMRVCLLYTIFLLGFYGLFFWQQQLWYFGPVMLCGSLLGGLAFNQLEEWASSDYLFFSRTIQMVTIGAVLMIGVVTWWNWHSGRIQIYPAQRAALALADLLSTHTELDARIGAWNSGILGFLVDRSVINLDGVVNNGLYAYARGRDVTVFDLCGLWPYLQRTGIDYLTDYEDIWSPEVDTLFSGRLERWAEIPVVASPLERQVRVYRVQEQASSPPVPSCPSALNVFK